MQLQAAEHRVILMDGVTEVAVIGVPDPILGNAIKAVLALRPGAHITKQEVLRHCSSRLEDFMMPRIVEFRVSLPKTESGKISKRMIASEPQDSSDVATSAV